MQYDEFRAMSTDIVLAAEGELASVAEGMLCVRAYIAAREAQFTRFSETSELAALNRAAGQWFNASPEMFELVQEAYALYQATAGLFDPTILEALERAGYDADLATVQTRSIRNDYVISTAPRGNFARVSFSPARHALWLPPGTRLDLGGIAKGWSAERAAYLLAAYAPACAVSAGGDLFAIGTPRGETGWQVDLDDPHNPTHALAALCVPPGAVATSTTTRRRWKQGDHEQHHLIDPRTGEPAETDWVSVTVLAPHATIAEVFAKALLIAGPREAGKIASARSDIAFLAVDRAGQLWGSDGVEEFLEDEM